MVGLGVCVPGVNGPGMRGERGELEFLQRMHEQKRPPATSPALFIHCCLSSQVAGGCRGCRNEYEIDSTMEAPPMLRRKWASPISNCHTVCWCHWKPANTGMEWERSGLAWALSQHGAPRQRGHEMLFIRLSLVCTLTPSPPCTLPSIIMIECGLISTILLILFMKS